MEAVDSRHSHSGLFLVHSRRHQLSCGPSSPPGDGRRGVWPPPPGGCCCCRHPLPACAISLAAGRSYGVWRRSRRGVTGAACCLSPRGECRCACTQVQHNSALQATPPPHGGGAGATTLTGLQALMYAFEGWPTAAVSMQMPVVWVVQPSAVAVRPARPLRCSEARHR